MLTDKVRSQLNDRTNSFPFFDRLTRTKDCNVATTSLAVELVTGRTLDAGEIRRMGRDLTGPTGNTLTRRVFQAVGMVSEVDYRMLRKVPTQTVRDLLRAGWFVTLYVEYGVLIDEAPQIVGSKTYRDAHAISVSDLWRHLGLKVHYHDPLADGRRPSIPMGVQTAPFPAIRNAGWAYCTRYEGGSAGMLSGWAVKPGKEAGQ